MAWPVSVSSLNVGRDTPGSRQQNKPSTVQQNGTSQSAAPHTLSVVHYGTDHKKEAFPNTTAVPTSSVTVAEDFDIWPNTASARGPDAPFDLTEPTGLILAGAGRAGKLDGARMICTEHVRQLCVQFGLM